MCNLFEVVNPFNVKKITNFISIDITCDSYKHIRINKSLRNCHIILAIVNMHIISLVNESSRTTHLPIEE